MKNEISRREFLETAVKAGIILTSPEFALHCSTTSDKRTSESFVKKDQFSWSEFPIVQALCIAVTAPNPHNTQPWKIRLDTPLGLTLYADASRALPAADPPFRQLHIGHGTLLELLRQAAGSLGYAAEIQLFPAGSYRAADIGKKPVATVRFTAAPGIQADTLFRYWTERMTDRTEYSGPTITAEEFQTLERLTAARGSTIRCIGDDPKLDKAVDFFYRAMAVEMHDVKCADETYRWFRLSDDEIAAKGDGLNLRGNGMRGFKLWMARTFFVSAEKTSFQSSSNTEAYLSAFKKVAESTRGLVLLTTETNTPLDWVRTGFDYMRFQLAVTSLGLAMQPVSQVLQEYPAMDSLRRDFESEMGMKEPSKIQVVVRLGRSDYRYFAPRRQIRTMFF